MPRQWTASNLLKELTLLSDVCPQIVEYTPLDVHDYARLIRVLGPLNSSFRGF